MHNRLGLLILTASFFYIRYLTKSRKNEEQKKYTDYWGLSMQFKGWVGGILFVIIGIILIIKGFQNL